MKKTILLGVALLLSISNAAFAQSAAANNSAVEAKIQTIEKSLWEAWKNRDAKPFNEYATVDSINVNADGSVDRGREAMIKDLSNPACTVTSFSLSDFSYLWIDRDSVIVTYTGTVDGACDGHKLPTKVIASSVWSSKGGKWVTAFHQESPAAASAM